MQDDVTNTTTTEPRRARTAGHSGEQPRRRRRRGLAVLLLVVLAAIGVGGAIVALNALTHNSNGIDSSKYQALFLTNGQVYFGKLSEGGDNTYVLKDIYYLQASSDSTNPQDASKDTSTDAKLIKLGSEVHGPEDEMVVMKDQALFYENLKNDGNVVKSIQQYESTNH